MADRKMLEAIWQAGVSRVNGYAAVKVAMTDHVQFQPTHIIAVGKAASPMARAALDQSGASLPALIVTKYHHAEESLAQYADLQLIESGHPVPDENSLLAGSAIIKFVEAMDKTAALLLLVSGGASALAEALGEATTLNDLKLLTRTMLAQGYDIHAINKRRKQLSLIKAGKLLARFGGREALVLAISDVRGDSIDVIGSGIGEVPSIANRKCKAISAHVIATNTMARQACAVEAEKQGLHIIANEETLYGDVFDIAKAKADLIKNGPAGLYIFGGEPVIELPQSPGEGGRNQALAVAMARQLSAQPGISVLVAGTDGSDGPTVSAGGYVTATDWAKTSGGTEALQAADSGSWLARSGGLFVTGPTGTNVMDIMLVLKR